MNVNTRVYLKFKCGWLKWWIHWQNVVKLQLDHGHFVHILMGKSKVVKKYRFFMCSMKWSNTHTHTNKKNVRFYDFQSIILFFSSQRHTHTHSHQRIFFRWMLSYGLDLFFFFRFPYVPLKHAKTYTHKSKQPNTGVYFSITKQNK